MEVTSECLHGCGERTWCTVCTACDKPARRTVTGTARADALYMPQGARYMDRKPPPRHMWTGRSRKPIGMLR